MGEAVGGAWLCRSCPALSASFSPPFPFFYHTLSSWSRRFCFAPGLKAMKPDDHRLKCNETAAQTDFSPCKSSLVFGHRSRRAPPHPLPWGHSLCESQTLRSSLRDGTGKECCLNHRASHGDGPGPRLGYISPSMDRSAYAILQAKGADWVLHPGSAGRKLHDYSRSPCPLSYTCDHCSLGALDSRQPMRALP